MKNNVLVAFGSMVAAFVIVKTIKGMNGNVRFVKTSETRQEQVTETKPAN